MLWNSALLPPPPPSWPPFLLSRYLSLGVESSQVALDPPLKLCYQVALLLKVLRSLICEMGMIREPTSGLWGRLMKFTRTEY